jgi:hypothetical protein
MNKDILSPSLLPGDVLRLRPNRLKHIRRRNWTFFRRIGGGRLLLLNERQPLSTHARNIDWETFRKKNRLLEGRMRKTGDSLSPGMV